MTDLGGLDYNQASRRKQKEDKTALEIANNPSEYQWHGTYEAKANKENAKSSVKVRRKGL
jgi:hypothetical protein